MNPSRENSGGQSGLTSDQRNVFRGIADVLILSSTTMPSAGQVGVHGPVIDRLLDQRPDIRERFLRGLDACMGENPDSAARSLNETDPTALAAIGLLASAAYYMDEEVRRLIGYPGQSARPFDPLAMPNYVANGQLRRVIDRGPIFRPTPTPAG